MAKFDDTITISQSIDQVREMLSDLQYHPSFVPDGFKNYRYLSRETAGAGARAAAELNLLGHWLPAELELTSTLEDAVVLHATVEPAEIDLRFTLLDRSGRTEVNMEVEYRRRMLKPWRVRTRVKQLLRLDHDARNLCGRFLTMLKKAAESPDGTAADAASVRVSAVSADVLAKRQKAAASRRKKAEEKAAATGVAPTTPPTDSAEYITACNETELAPGQARVVKVKGTDVALFNVDGEFYAIANACAHRGGPLGFGLLEGKIVTCPLHSFTFNVTDGACQNAPGLRVPRYEVRRENGALQIRSSPANA